MHDLLSSGVISKNIPGPVPPRSMQNLSLKGNKFLMPLSEAEFTITSILEELQRDPNPVKNDRRHLRSTGAALSVAVGLLENSCPNMGARIMLFTGGPATQGPGMVVSDDLKEPIRSHTDLAKESCKYTKSAIKVIILLLFLNINFFLKSFMKL